MADKDKDGDTTSAGDQIMVSLLVGGVALFLAPTVLAAVAIYLLMVRRATRVEAAIVAVAAITISVLWLGFGITQYLSWWGEILGGNWGALITGFPWLAILAGATTLACLFRLVADLPVVAGVGQRLGFLHKKTALEELTDYESIIPEEQQRNAIQIADAPGELLRIDADAHALDSPHTPGTRTFPIAVGAHGTPVSIAESELRMHGLIFGSTGAGKTEAIKVIAGALMDLGWDGIILDHKEDVAKGGLRDWCESYASTHARPYQQIYLSEDHPSVWFNPIGGMGSDEARDTILASQSFPDAFWEAINRNELGQIVSMIYDAYTYDPATIGEPSPMDIADVMRAGEGMRKSASRYLATIAAHKYPDLREQERQNKAHNREETARQKNDPSYTPRTKPADLVAAALEKDYPIVYHPSKDEVSAARGFASRLESIYFTNVGKTILNFSADRRMFNVDTPGLTYVGLDSQGKPDLTRIISASVMRRLCVLASQRIRAGRPPKQKFVIIDEANVVDRSSLMELLSRARSAGITIIAATQGPKDYNMNLDGSPFSGPGFQEIAQNTNVLVAMSQGTQEQAEIIAEAIGFEDRVLPPTTATQEGELVNSGGVRTVRTWMVSPEQLRDLRIGEAIVRVSKPRQRIEWAQFKMRPE